MKSYISDQELDYFTVVNPPDTYAYVALTGEGEVERIVAVGRWFLSPGGRTAEIAFVVEDTIQVRGIGTALLEQLAEAAAKYRIKRFVARVLPKIPGCLRSLRIAGFNHQTDI
jgi:GNAT superfamily N-acetyltransferase